MPKYIEITRRDLYNQVWQEPMLHLAKTYGMSDVGLAKICKRYNIPRPYLGYWAKVQAGKRARKIPLPKPKTYNPVIEIRDRFYKNPTNALEEAIKFEKDPANRIVVGNKLTNPHPLVQEAKEYFEERDELDRKGEWRESRPHLLLSHRSTKGRERGLLLYDALIKALEARGFPVGLDKTSNWSCHNPFAAIWNVKIYFKIMEQENQPAGNHRPYMTMERLFAISFKNRRINWRDSARQDISNQLNSFVEGMLVDAWDRKATVERELKDYREAKVEQERRSRIVDAYQEEMGRVDQLTEEADDWHEAEKLRAYIKAAKEAGTVDPEWVKWASDQADRQDPLKESPASVLDDRPPSDWFGGDRGVRVYMGSARTWAYKIEDDGS